MHLNFWLREYSYWKEPQLQSYRCVTQAAGELILSQMILVSKFVRFYHGLLLLSNGSCILIYYHTDEFEILSMAIFLHLARKSSYGDVCLLMSSVYDMASASRFAGEEGC